MVCESTQMHAEDGIVPASPDSIPTCSGTTMGGTIEEVDIKLVIIESDLLPKLTKERTDAEIELNDLLAQVAEENKQLRTELEQRKERFRTLFAEYTRLKPLLVANCKRTIRESRGWTSHEWKKADNPYSGREWKSEPQSYERNWKSSYENQESSSNENRWKPAYNAPKQETSSYRWNSSSGTNYSNQKLSYTDRSAAGSGNRWNASSGTGYGDQKQSYNETNNDGSESRWNSLSSTTDHKERSGSRWNTSLKPSYDEQKHDSWTSSSGAKPSYSEAKTDEGRWTGHSSWNRTAEPDAHDEDAFKPRWSTEVAAAKRVEKWDSQWVKTKDESNWWKASADNVTYKARDGSRWTPQDPPAEEKPTRSKNWNTEYYKASDQELPRHVLDRIASIRPVQEQASGEYVSLC